MKLDVPNYVLFSMINLWMRFL